MSENALWDIVRKYLGPFGVLQRIENRVDVGTPDFLYLIRRATGLVELKHEEFWPVGARTPLVIKSLTLEQVLWLEAWARAPGGRAWCLLQVARHYILLQPEVVRAIFLRQLVAADVLQQATVVGTGKFPTVEIIKCLSD